MATSSQCAAALEHLAAYRFREMADATEDAEEAAAEEAAAAMGGSGGLPSPAAGIRRPPSKLAEQHDLFTPQLGACIPPCVSPASPLPASPLRLPCISPASLPHLRWISPASRIGTLLHTWSSSANAPSDHLPNMAGTLLHMIVFGECTNQWSLSRPLLVLILISEEPYAETTPRPRRDHAEITPRSQLTHLGGRFSTHWYAEKTKRPPS